MQYILHVYVLKAPIILNENCTPDSVLSNLTNEEFTVTLVLNKYKIQLQI